MESAKKELTKLTSESKQDKAIVKKVKTSLDKDIKAIRISQDTKIVELGWAVVAAHQDDELASDSGSIKPKGGRELSKSKQTALSAAAKRKPAVTTWMTELLIPVPAPL